MTSPLDNISGVWFSFRDCCGNCKFFRPLGGIHDRPDSTISGPYCFLSGCPIDSFDSGGNLGCWTPHSNLPAIVINWWETTLGEITFSDWIKEREETP